MPVVVPLKDKPGLSEEQIAEAICEHVAWEEQGRSRMPGGIWKEHRKCADCGHAWSVEDFSQEEDDWKEEAAPGKPPKAVYGHAQVITYQTDKAQYDLVVGELAMASVQNGLLVLQHHDSPVVGIVGVRPWLEPEKGEDSGDQVHG